MRYTLILVFLLAVSARAADRPSLLKAPFDKAAAAEKQREWATYLHRTAVDTNSLGIKLVLIPAGEFVIGSPDNESGADPDEHPSHDVTITRPFYIGTCAVTVGQFGKFVAATGYKTDAENDGKGGCGATGETTAPFDQRPKFNWRNDGLTQTDTQPVVNVSWNDAIAFCDWLSSQDGKTYRLPTDAQREFACRGGTTATFFFGSDPGLLGKYAWNSDNSSLGPHDVGQKLPNPLGLYDMLGNVWEWCSDRYDAKYYRSSPAIDPQGPVDGNERVTRGGSWGNTSGSCRSADRDRMEQAGRSCYLGFRVVREP